MTARPAGIHRRGRWFAGRWHTGPAQQYIRFVKKYLRERIWTTPDFQQP